MKQSTRETLEPLLRFLRSYACLEETLESRFLLKGKDFVHFHDDPDGLWADAKLSKGRLRLSVATRAEQGELMSLIVEKLDMLDSHEKRSRGKDRNRRST